MESREENTKGLLMRTAGELFAEHGLDGVSTRMIADKAGVTLGSIHYHFGSKENLYLEACRLAMERKRCNGFAEVLAENPFLAEKPAGQAEIIRNVVYRSFHDYFRPDKPKWETQILIREVVNPSSAGPVIAEELFKPDMQGCLAFFYRVRPEASELEAQAWISVFHAQVFFYATARETIALIRGVEELDSDFYHQAARTVSRAMILLLGLPLPEDLRE